MKVEKIKTTSFDLPFGLKVKTIRVLPNSSIFITTHLKSRLRWIKPMATCTRRLGKTEMQDIDLPETLKAGAPFSAEPPEAEKGIPHVQFVEVGKTYPGQTHPALKQI